jgi:hypothetical protein
MNARTLMVTILVLINVVLLLWAVISLLRGEISLLSALIYIVGAVWFIRLMLTTYRKYSFAAPGFTTPLAISSPANQGMTPALVADLLNRDSVIQVIKNDLAKTALIGYKEVWRLGVMTPDQDRFDPSLYQLSRQERLKRSLNDYNSLLNFTEQIPLKRRAVLYNPATFNLQFNNLVVARGNVKPAVRGYPGWSYGLSTQLSQGEFIPIRHLQLEPRPASATPRSRQILQFLQEDGFPLKDIYIDGDPLTTERGGIIVNDHGKIVVIRPKYFVQRRVIDDQGELIYLGLDEDFSSNALFNIEVRPSVSARLIRCVQAYGYLPILRYRSFPYASDFMLPLLDTPMSMSGWAELFIDTRGKAKLFIAKDKTLPEWYELMNRLKQLLYSELARVDHHLLGLTKDQARLHDYLTQKQTILEDYYVIMDWKWC